jgi:peptide/nickel transport system permease protein
MRTAQRLLTRLIVGLITLWGVLTILFLSAHAGGDPVKQLVPPNATPQEITTVTKFLGLDHPLIVQYGSFLAHAVRGDFGQSYYFLRPALPLVLSRVPATLLLVAVSVAGAVLVSFTAAFVAAFHRGGLIDRVLSAGAALSTALPSFWVGTLLLIIFAVDVRIFPVTGDRGPRSIVLPAVTLGLFQIGVYFQIIRAASLGVLRSDFVRLVESKGVSRLRLVTDHLLWNVGLTALTIVGLAFGTTLGGTVIVEVIFGWPGIGTLLLQAASQYDFPVLESCVLVIAAGFILVNLAVDALYTFLSPQTATFLKSRAPLAGAQRAA